VSAVAELLADGGAAAAGEEFFRSTPFLDAEGVTHTLRIEAGGGELLAPVLIREIPGSDRIDAVSPYGYPGLAGETGAPLDPAAIEFGPTGLVSLFIRHTLSEPPLTGASERNVVQIADPDLPPKSRGSDRNQINRNWRAGYRVRIVRGSEADAGDLAGFLAAYEETMRRTGASERYFFGGEYFGRILEFDDAWLALADSPEGGIAAASIAVRSDGFLHYYLSGSADSHLRDSPMKNVIAALVEHSAELDLPLNLGGGITPGDPLEEFKRGFANRDQIWHTSEIICDPERYSALSSGRAQTDFFPLYRSE
jgi:hypothetical protein